MEKILKNIGQSFYSWLEKSTVENWRQEIADPIDTFCHYGGQAGKDLSMLYKQYENDEKTVEYIDNFLNKIVEDVNSSTVSYTHGGYRPGAGRKTSYSSGKRKKFITVAATAEQAQKIKDNAKVKGKTVSSYLLELALSDK